MLRSLREDWRCLRRGETGRRFQDLHATCRARSRRTAGRVLALVAGGTLVVAAPVASVLPGPGGTVLFVIGLALLAREALPVARALDRLEPRAHGIGRPLLRVWRRTSAGARTALCLLAAACAVGVSYLAYAWLASRG